MGPSPTWIITVYEAVKPIQVDKIAPADTKVFRGQLKLKKVALRAEFITQSIAKFYAVPSDEVLLIPNGWIIPLKQLSGAYTISIGEPRDPLRYIKPKRP